MPPSRYRGAERRRFGSSAVTCLTFFLACTQLKPTRGVKVPQGRSGLKNEAELAHILRRWCEKTMMKVIVNNK